MPTYTFQCQRCGRKAAHVMSIGDYLRWQPEACCAEPMARTFEVDPQTVKNPLAGDRHYDGMRAQDGSDISSRTKHRQYMKDHNVTTIDDYTETWKRAAQERADRLAGVDPARARDIADAIDKLGG